MSLTRLIADFTEDNLRGRGLTIDWSTAPVEPDPPVIVATRVPEEPPEIAEPPSSVDLPDGPPLAAVLSFDPASGKRGGDAFGRAVILAYAEVALVIDAGVMPRFGEGKRAITQREHAGLALDFHLRLRQRMMEWGAPSAPVWIVSDAKGSGTAFIEALRELAGPELATRFIIGFELSGNVRFSRWPPKREERTRHLSWVVGTSWVVESTNAALQAGRLVVAPNVPDLAALLDERSRYRARILPSGQVRFAAGGRGHDDRLSAVLMGALVARHCVRKRKPVPSTEALVGQLGETL